MLRRTTDMRHGRSRCGRTGRGSPGAAALLLAGAVFAAPAGLRAQDGPASAEKSAARTVPDATRAPDAGGAGSDVEVAVAKDFAALADSDPAVRDAARVRLMGVERRYLPALRTLVEQHRPLAPSQAAVLRQIVTHVYLAGEPYEAVRGAGFLGVKLHSAAVSLDLPARRGAAAGVRAVDPAAAADPGADRAAAAADLAEMFPLPQMGVVIAERIPGFVGSRLLLDGDVILAIADKPHLEFAGGTEFTDAVRQTPPGRPLHFIVLRHGRLVKVLIPLDPRPTAAADVFNPDAMTELDHRRREKAEAYWRESFGPLLKESVG